MDFEEPRHPRSSPILSELPFSKSHLSSLDGGRLQNQQGHIPAETHLADPGIVLREDHHHGLFHDIIPHGTENGTGNGTAQAAATATGQGAANVTLK